MYGSDRVLLYLVRALKQRMRFEPVVVVPVPGPLTDALTAEGIEVHVAEVAKISRQMMNVGGAAHLLWRLIRCVHDIDRIVGQRKVVLVHSNTLSVLGGAAWAARRRVRHLWHVHEILVSPKILSTAFPRVVKALSHCVVSNSTMTEKWLLMQQPNLVKRSTVVFNGLPQVNPPPQSEINTYRESVGAQPGDLIVSLVGRVNAMKGQHLMIDAARHLHESGSAGNLRFVIVGDTIPGMEGLLAHLRDRITASGLSQRFTVVPFVHDIWPVWFGSDICLVPSTQPESFGMVALEAMAAGVPVVAAAHGGVLDIVVDAETGLLFEPGNAHALSNAIKQLADDRQLRMRLGRAGARRQIEKFSLAKHIEQMEEVYGVLIRAQS